MEDNGYSEIYTKIEFKNRPFKKHQTDILTAQSFDKEKITVKKRGKVINQYDFTQASAGENDFYKNLEKYNGDVNMTAEALNKMHNKLSDDLIAIKSIEDVAEYQKATQNAWEQLPLNVRKEFSMDINKFRNGGEKWVQNKINEYNELIKKQQEQMINIIEEQK